MSRPAEHIAPPTVCVVTRTRDRAIMLPRVLESVRSQGYPRLTWVIVNDGGQTGPVDAMAASAAGLGLDVRVIHHPESRGMEAASNAGIASTASDLVVIHDDDDSWHPDFLKAMTAAMATVPDQAGVVCHAVRVDERIDGEHVRKVRSYPYNNWLRAIYLSEIAIENKFPPISFLFKRGVWVEVGGFDESLPVMGDWDFNLKVLLKHDIALVPRPLANYHHRPAGSSYGNSLIAEISKHVTYDAVVRNRYLRKDIALGKPGLGFLLADGRARLSLRRHLALVGLIARVVEIAARPIRPILLRIVDR